MPPRRQQGVPPRRGPPRQGRREIYDLIDVGMQDVESVHQDRTEIEINSPPRSRQRVQSEAENVPPPPPFDMDDLLFLRQEIQELRAEKRAVRREVDQVRLLQFHFQFHLLQLQLHHNLLHRCLGA